MSGCDCVRCQTEECDASELCGCCLNAEVERLTTAIQRVRELHHAYDAMDQRRRCGCCGHPWPCLTAQALNGDKCPTCEGPIRETVGLVCQTCGTDYGAQGDSDE